MKLICLLLLIMLVCVLNASHPAVAVENNDPKELALKPSESPKPTKTTKPAKPTKPGKKTKPTKPAKSDVIKPIKKTKNSNLLGFTTKTKRKSKSTEEKPDAWDFKYIIHV